MANAPKLTQRDMIYQLYDRVLGQNGTSMATKVDELWDARGAYVLKADCAAVHKAEAETAVTKKRSTASIIREVIQWALTLVVGTGLAWRLIT